MSTSRVELAQTDIVTAFQAITTANGYRSNIAEVTTLFQDISADTLASPIASVLMYDETIAPDNAVTWNSMRSEVLCEVVGQVLSTQAEALAHDFKRVMRAMSVAHQMGTGSWWLSPKKPTKIFRSPLATAPDGSDVKAWITAQFWIMLAAEGPDF